MMYNGDRDSATNSTNKDVIKKEWFDEEICCIYFRDNDCCVDLDSKCTFVFDRFFFWYMICLSFGHCCLLSCPLSSKKGT